MAESVLITGASTGLGKEMALYLAAQGFQVYATMRDMSGADSLHATAKHRGVELHILPLDVTDKASIDKAVETMVRDTGGIYGLVNNAGIGLRGYFEDLANAEIRQLFDANVFGVMEVTRAVLPHMRREGRGRILLISSVAGRIGSLGVSAYCSTKFALEGFGESLALEVEPLGVRVVIVEPGIIQTERWTTNRGIAAGADNPDSPYYEWFRQAEKEADQLVRASSTTPQDVAVTVYRALTVHNPKLRYMVGRKASLVVALRRYIPREWFERLYFKIVMRRVTRPRKNLRPGQAS